MLTLFGEELPEPGKMRPDWRADTEWLPLGEELPQWLDGVLDRTNGLPGGLRDTQVDVLDTVLTIEHRTADDFNFRGDAKRYRERAQADSADFSDTMRDAVAEYTDQLGLVHPVDPRHRRYDMTLVLGGGYRSPLLRARFARLLESQGVDLGELYFLGSPRFLIAEPPEALDVADYAPTARDEFDLLVAAAHSEFELDAASPEFLCGCRTADTRCPQWLRSHQDAATETPSEYTHERRIQLSDSTDRARGWVLSACTGRPPYRPDTSDTFGLWARTASPTTRQRVLIVTTQVFVPFQTFDGIKRLYLQHGVDVEAVGFGAEWGDRPLTAEYLLQETLSAIRSARRLVVDAVDILRHSSAA
ncbi:hypothetical protein [Nocardia altamirensis]|uniref:hypothetical protein n=1 Tax=Nocardia altamirensis TaxID=472158 RepID=UPI00114CD432|nr:hypothetical protein [Nocardia altamirensis]